ncbi:MAG: hypothetical protein Fur0021_21760 [Candidatus Promineifilaceae bacterium]
MFDSLLEGRRPIYIAAGVTVLGLILLVVFALLLLRSPDEDNGDQTVEATATLSELGDGGGLPATPPPDVVVLGISNSATISVTLSTPTTLDIDGRRFGLRAELVTAGERWQPELPNATTAVWVYGTVVNYVIGLADTAEARALLDGLTPGDLISLTTRGGTVSQFTFASRDIVPATSADVFAQNTPGVTLVLLGTEGENRLVVRGRYVVPETSSASASSVVELGETAQLDTLQLTVMGTTHLANEPSAPPGFAFFLVDYELLNVGQQQVDLSRLRLSLIDQFGNQYAVNALAGQFGNHPLASGTLGANQLVAATVGYQIPASLSAPTLRWVAQYGDSPAKVEVNLPFNRTQTNAAVVTVLQAEVSLDGASLALQGQVTNLGSEQLIVSEQDVSLSSLGTVYLMFANNPAFPWVIDAGQTVPFALTFQRPQESSAILTVLNYPFQLEGLR